MSYVTIFIELLQTDWMLIKQKIVRLLINTAIWAGSFSFGSAYVLPLLGIHESYGAFMTVGSLVSCGVFQIFWSVATIIGDLDGDSTVSYELTLPLPGWLLWVQKACSYGISSFLISLIILPLGKLILLQKLPLTHANPWLFLPMLASVHLLCGFFALFLTGLIPSMQQIELVWTRVLFPLWFFGGTQFSWKTCLALSPMFAWISLINPLLYASEGLRAVVLDPAQSLSPWVCFAGMWTWIFIFGYFGVRKMKKRLDSI